MKKYIFIFFIFFVSTLSSFAQSGIGLNLGTEYGMGVLAQFGSQSAKFEIGAGATPILTVWEITVIGSGYTGDDTYIKFYLSGTFGAKLNIALNDKDKGRLGLKFGPVYDTVMKTGYSLGVDYNVSKKPKNIVISAGFTYYPDAYDELFDRLIEEENIDIAKDDVSAPLTNFRPFVGITLFFGE